MDIEVNNLMLKKRIENSFVESLYRKEEIPKS